MTKPLSPGDNFERVLRLVMRIAIRKGKLPPPLVAGRGLQVLVDTLGEADLGPLEIADWLRAQASNIERNAPRLHS
jgi:hypothetical protein